MIGVSERQEEQKGLENLFEKMTEKIPDMGKKKIIQVQRVPSKMNLKSTTPRNVIITMANINDKERSLKAERDRELPTKDSPSDYQMISQQKHTKLEGNGMKYEVMQNKGLNPRILHPARLSIKIEQEIRSFADKKKMLREFITSKPAMQEMLKGML
uniref:Uncharacterized protein n=1 Tax=Myotis myotis TaxID=51298 RepID=A0A7J7YE18_MYOMY|nr:hypothetical protein mMyoMyo1_011082 [Myotis myotis]